MNIIALPFHDWRKSESEGFRTRDVHFIKSFEKLECVSKILVINRPFTILELILKGHSSRLKGDVVLSTSKFQLTKVSEKIYVVDFNSFDILGQIFKKHKWFIDKYNNHQYNNFIKKVRNILKMEDATLICQNLFAYKLTNTLGASFKLFDAWDNFLKFPTYKYMLSDMLVAYNSLSKSTCFWITNSSENMDYFSSKFSPKNIRLVTNGVNQDFLSGDEECPSDILSLPRPIVGFGGKVSYLLDVDLINYITLKNPGCSFVFVGQILDRSVFDKIIKRSNIFFLGDKNYSVYPKYVNQFDIGIIPYHINERQHGGDSIKAYEYLFAGIKVVGTRGNGLVSLEKYLYLCENKYEFSESLSCTKNNKDFFPVLQYTWEKKSIEILNLHK